MNVLSLRFHDTPRQTWSLPRSPAAAIALATLFAASADMLSAVVYWGLRGVAPERVFAAVARWAIDAPLPEAWMVSLAGFATLAVLYLPAVVVLEAWSARHRRAPESTMATGAAWGLLTYVAIFQLAVPAIVQPPMPDRSMGWIATCVAVHAVLIGPMAARMLRHARPR